jgi:hypothetical protein
MKQQKRWKTTEVAKDIKKLREKAKVTIEKVR